MRPVRRGTRLLTPGAALASGSRERGWCYPPESLVRIDALGLSRTFRLDRVRLWSSLLVCVFTWGPMSCC
ncbi:MAG: hypothetical protein RMK29_02755 [Myxococcales bacterium]|nr:hypothetical protein [Myxococcota bacterium]MDW8280602.1 hypothetical protein [Myxococcales bacterium]